MSVSALRWEPRAPEEPDPWAPKVPPGEDELPYDDGEPMESTEHRMCMSLIIECLVEWLLRQGRHDVFVGGNLGFYFSEIQATHNDFRAPDVMVVEDTTDRPRKSWVMWQEGQVPSLIVELTSPSTRKEDHGRKKRIYGRALHIPFYVLFDPFTADLQVLQLVNGDYHPLPLVNGGAETILGLELAVWKGAIQHVEGSWLRWREPNGAWLPTGAELAGLERSRAELERSRADLERSRAELERSRADLAEEKARRLAVRLAELGLSTD